MGVKNAKIALFSTLIVAIILPFNMISSAEGQTNDKTTKLIQYKKELKSQMTKTKDESEKEEIRLVLQRVNIILDLLQVNVNLRSSSIEQVNANNTTETLLAKLDATFDDSDSQTLEPGNSDRAVSRAGTTNFQTSVQTKFNCDTISTQTGYNWGTVTGIDFTESYVVGVQGYPSSIAIMENNYCTVKNFDSGYIKYRNISTGNMCTSILDDANSTESGYCAKFGSGNPVLITSFAWYDGTNPFNITEGWDFIWVP